MHMWRGDFGRGFICLDLWSALEGESFHEIAWPIRRGETIRLATTLTLISGALQASYNITILDRVE